MVQLKNYVCSLRYLKILKVVGLGLRICDFQIKES